MSGYYRSIKIAFDEKSGEVIEAEQVFDTKKNAFLTRKQFHRDEIALYCCECLQKLKVSTSKFDRLHFKHEPNHNPCKLTNGILSPAEIDEMNRVFIAKESPRHIELKNKIGRLLADVDEIDKESIAIDNKVICFNSEKRRPDVYCIYKNRQIVFEIQLSNLSLKYLLGRHEFYKKTKFILYGFWTNLTSMTSHKWQEI